MKKFLSVLLALTLMFSVAACGSSSDEGDAGQDDGGKVYIVATEPTFPPFETVDEATGEITGFDIVRSADHPNNRRISPPDRE